MHPIRFTVRIDCLGTTLCLEQGFDPLLVSFLPKANLHRIDVKFFGNLVDGLAAAHAHLTKLGFALRRVHVALLRFTHDFWNTWKRRHRICLSQVREPLWQTRSAWSAQCQAWGLIYTLFLLAALMWIALIAINIIANGGTDQPVWRGVPVPADPFQVLASAHQYRSSARPRGQSG